MGLGGLEDREDFLGDVLDHRGHQQFLGRKDVAHGANGDARLGGHRPEGGPGDAVAEERGSGRGHVLSAPLGALTYATAHTSFIR